ncbi:DeoR/GlpR family DNA-binding transcription regulator [Solirubrobacter phytolaccae]|uniref:DeoR/GlpR family DNA-binding transcription regulator n=1 Tax=Solirubrobacter phytolaccae TaxID=1404360 RepID=A0A9X3SAB4_9ACTN|nr:DeoR/GlpR family DNA-binding transcription regulator [Solirubrobacter phytolaccae]MDA0180155.1 DeoR/GlpR family DNA-binding transcription regulator [Solirubrobacter phytolaccae]
MSTIPPALRRAQILERIQRDGGVSVADLARELTVSSITVHRDLEQLSRDGLVERVHGGARALPAAGPATAIPPTGWEQRAAVARGAKAVIAAHAAREVQSGSTIFLDSSSSCLALARQLVVSEAASNLTLVTNSPAIAYELADERMLVIVTPGELDQHMRLLAGRWTTDFLAGLNFELAFVSCAGVTLDAGLTTSRRALADVINVASANAARTVGLIDSNKFGRASLLTIARAEDLDAIVTDEGLDEATEHTYRAAGVALEIAK